MCQLLENVPEAINVPGLLKPVNVWVSRVACCSAIPRFWTGWEIGTDGFKDEHFQICWPKRRVTRDSSKRWTQLNASEQHFQRSGGADFYKRTWRGVWRRQKLWMGLSAALGAEQFFLNLLLGPAHFSHRLDLMFSWVYFTHDVFYIARSIVFDRESSSQHGFFFGCSDTCQNAKTFSPLICRCFIRSCWKALQRL